MSHVLSHQCSLLCIQRPSSSTLLEAIGRYLSLKKICWPCRSPDGSLDVWSEPENRLVDASAAAGSRTKGDLNHALHDDHDPRRLQQARAARLHARHGSGEADGKIQ